MVRYWVKKSIIQTPMERKVEMEATYHVVADLGFPVGGGRAPVRGAWTSNAGTFQ